MNEQVWWFVARSGGIVAWALITISVCWGLLLSTKAASKAAQPKQILDLHRFLGGLSVTFTAVHLAGLVADSYVEFGWLEILVPWASSWRPTAVAWGVVAFYLLVAVEATSLFMKRLPKPVWRHVHRTSLGLYVFATVHGLQAGTDTGNQWYQMAMLASINVVAFLTVIMILARRRQRTGGTARPAERTAQTSRPLSSVTS
ncbi:MAG: ferric reductase-like transmembrane domain-containing protein [Acidimicrobiia bacterium]|nr:ferric reductase-like transmembrane domain-containing protein [Acidimicrobiia bacterium]